ncbi:amidase [Brevibacterium permense]|uniref:amidase n=1 Tax=Brevibacterium permense TaxID=234834 RepID=UPI0021D34DD9|nr:amidase [Brevibacterium permense]MCU4298550.1 amidase [Brevibacterium permense]
MDEHALAEVERAGTQFNAVTAMTVDRANALTAESIDRRDSGQPPRRLEGIPFAIKDVIDLVGYPTTMGSNVRSDAPATTSATVVDRLETAGAIPVAKTNCQEYSYGILGDESAFGRVVNPVDPELCTAGSSSGSAALVAAGVVPLSLGTDTAGSVRVPAACQGVLGFKPTFGVVPVDGVFPLSQSFDTVGLFASDLGILTRAFDVIAGTGAGDDRGDSAASGIAAGGWTGPAAGRTGTAATPVDGSMGSGERTLDVSLFAEDDDRSNELLMSVPDLTITSANGPVLDDLLDDLAPIYDYIRLYEAFEVHKDLFAERAADYQPGVATKVEAGRRLEHAEYRKQLDALAELRKRSLAVFGGTDYLLTPAIDGPVVRWDEIDSGTAAKLMRYSMPFNVLGWPALTIPLPGAGAGPQAVQLVGRPGGDRELLAFASRLV